jgi:hypothetical protein
MWYASGSHQEVNDHAHTIADRVETDEVRAAWLQLVQGWLALMPKRELSREQVFDAQVKAQ